jgi:hypothetical protein
MKITIPSPRDEQYCDQEAIESPTTPSSTPLMSSMHSSPSSSSQEKVPILSAFEESFSDEIPRHNGERSRRRGRPYFIPRCTTACIAFISLLMLSYVFISKESTTGHIKSSLSRLRKKIDPVVVDTNDNVPITSSQSPLAHVTTYSPSPDPSSKPTVKPTVKPSIQPTIKPSVSPSAHASPDPSSKPTARPSAKPTVTPTSSQGHNDSIEEIRTEKISEKNDMSKAAVNVDKKEKKQNLVLHIGPQKTGSTTLQDAWTEPVGLISKSLIDDNYRYHFINPDRGYFDCDVGEFGGYQNCSASSRLKGAINEAVNAGENLLLSDENLDERFVVALRDIIDDNQWDVTVIVVYRRIHQWLVSWYNQINKTTNTDSKGNILINNNGLPYRVEHTRWPDEGGGHIPSFTTWYKEYTQYWDPSELVSKHRSISFMNTYKPYFSNIVVHNMHQDGDLVANFMCDSVPAADHSCNQLRKQGQVPRDNMSVNLDYDILAVKARENGLLMDNLSRKETVYAIGKFIERTGKLIPRACDANMINEIQHWLLNSEAAIFTDSWSDQRAHDLEETFDAYLKKGKLCDVDFDQVFSDIQWLDFFANLDSRPHLVIHVGPQKTGSTTLQHVWAAPKELGNVLREDNFLYEYVNIHRGTFDCDVDGDVYTNCKASNELLQLFEKASREQKHLLISDENLDERFAGALRDAIDDRKFRVKVVVVYRQIHQWLPSWYSQINKNTDRDSKGNLLQDENGLVIIEPHTHWPSEGGTHIPSFTAWYKEFTQYWDSSDLAPHHPSVHFMNVYKPYFDHVNIYDMNQKGDFVTNFMCQMFPEAPKTCKHLKEEMNLPLSNPSVNVEHDILSVQAYENGLIDKKLTRSMVVSEVTKYVKESGKTLPRQCETGMIDQIRDWLLDSEEAMLPDKWSADYRDALERTFNSYYPNGKLCDVDIEKVLSDNDWVEFFSSLGRSRSLLENQDWLKSFISYFENY